MQVEQRRCTRDAGGPDAVGSADADLVLLFGAGDLLADETRLAALRREYPAAILAGCSTAGEICGTEVTDDTVVATAVRFQATRIEGARVAVAAPEDSASAGRRAAAALDPDGLVHALVLSDGLHVNGSQLVEGLVEALPAGVTATGGLAGDGDRFQATAVAFAGRGEAATCRPRSVVVVGFYGERLRVGYASLGGWDSFGPERRVTRAAGNVVYELDGRSALDLYERYLGEHAAELPASGLLFPLSVRTADHPEPVVRTILAVDRSARSITFAGDVPQGALARLMKANFDRLIDGAVGAARTAAASVLDRSDLALLISCVGRRLVLGQRIEEELEGVRDVLGSAATLAGFYSYGEISPFTPDARCALHNQTMTITTFSER